MYIRYTETIAVTLKRGRKLRGGKANPWNPSNDKSHLYLFLCFFPTGKKRNVRRDVISLSTRDNPGRNTFAILQQTISFDNCAKFYNFPRRQYLIISFHIVGNCRSKNRVRRDNSRLDNRLGKCIDSSLDELQSASKFNYCNPIVLLVHHRLAKWNTITRCLPGEPPIACEPWNPISCGFLADSGVGSKPSYQRLWALKNKLVGNWWAWMDPW